MNFVNPYRPGAGHKPPYLAGREREKEEFSKLLKQTEILENLVLTGLRGVGKTVLMEELKPMATLSRWIWVGSDLSETTSVSEQNLAIRILTDISVVTSSIVVGENSKPPFGFLGAGEKQDIKLGFDVLLQIYENTPGLSSDKLKGTLEYIFTILPINRNTVIFAYDEAQNLSDNAAKDQYPLSMLLDVFQSLQRKGIPFMLALAGLPTLFPNLVEARTFAERMFRVIFLDQLDDAASREAIVVPLNAENCPVRPDKKSVSTIVRQSGGYPYFIQFICREVYDIWINDPGASVPIKDISYKLDTDFFAGRWARATDRQRDLLILVAQLKNSDGEFTVQEVVTSSQNTEKPFSGSQINQMFATLCNRGLLYKNRHGKYSFAVPLLGNFILRQLA